MHQYTSIAYMGKNVTSYNKYYLYSDSGCAGRGLRWKATPLMPNLAEYQHQDETDLDRHGWTPLDYFEQYIDRDLMMTIAECSNIMSLSKSGEPLNMTTDEIYHFFGACILISYIRYPTIRMYWSKALKITAITDKFTRARFFKLRGAIKVVIDHDVPEDLRMSDKFWKVRPFLDRILQGCLSLNRPDCASIDEQMIPFTGACPYRQYLPMKPNPVGIKNFVCATADGIVLDFELYQGTGSLIGKVEVVCSEVVRQQTSIADVCCSWYTARRHLPALGQENETICHCLATKHYPWVQQQDGRSWFDG